MSKILIIDDHGVSTPGDVVSPLQFLGSTIVVQGATSPFSLVATSGSYLDLSNRPSIPSAQVNSDWSAVSGVAQVLNKPTLGTAAAQNSSAFDAAGSASAAQSFAIQRANQTGTQSASTITGLATVATSGAYADLTGLPSIPAAQVNSDWNSVSGVSQVLNKPTLGTASTQNTSAFATAAQGLLAGSALQPGASIPWSTLTGTPTTLTGYGITDAVPSSRTVNGHALTVNVTVTQSDVGLSLVENTALSTWAGSASLNTVGTVTTGVWSGTALVDARIASAATWNAKQGSITLTTTGSSGAATFAANTLNIPNYANSGGTVTSVGVTGSEFSITGSPVTGSGSIALALAASGVSAGTYNGVTVNAKGIVTAATNRSFANTASRSISTTNNTGNGFQLSATRDSFVTYAVSIQTTTTIGGPSSGTIVLEICATNSATGASWTTIDTFVNNNTAALAIVLQFVALNVLNICGIVPAGWFARVRSVPATGTVTYSTTATGQEVLL